jgi:mono/diheme cytochrome c family protein
MRPRAFALCSIGLLILVSTQAGFAQRSASRGAAAAGAAQTGATAVTAGAISAPPLAVDAQRAFINDYCSGCHNDRTKSGGMTLTALDPARAEASPELAEKVIRKLRTGLMPPAGAKRPDFQLASAIAASLESSMDRFAQANPNPGSRPFQRLSRAEYARSIHDLLDIDIDVSALLPPDTFSAGFDNIADAQSFSPTVMESYIRAAARIATEALGDPGATATSVTYTVPYTMSQMRRVEGAPYGTRGGISIVHNMPADGEYVFDVRMQAATNGGMIGSRSANEQIEISVNGERVALLELPAGMSESSARGLNLRTGRIFVKAGPQRISAAFMPKFSGLTDDLVSPLEFTLADAIGSPQILQVPHLQHLNITGPFTVTGVSETPAHRRLFSCQPRTTAEELPCATTIIKRLGEQAYRRPLGTQDVDDLLGFFKEGRRDASFDAGIRTALQAVLASPHFVFRLEPPPANVATGTNYRLGDLELATRLSYFLWSTGPDAELLAAARSNRLHTPAELERQTRRMLADPRADALSTRFATQWLHLSELETMIPDALLYPQYDHVLAQSMRRETELFFDSLVRSDANVLDLLTADHTFVDERLAKHYQIPGILGSRFRRVTLKDDVRRGLLGKGAILVMTSNSDRTSPVLRGKWVMEVLLGTPPPPPPPNVPGLEATNAVKDGHFRSVRERLEAHRASPACASCHRMIDPLGLALENFDVTGVWRRKDAGVVIDPSSTLFDGTPLSGPADLRQAVLKYSDAFVSNLTENLLTYATGRRLEYYDMAAVRTIRRDAARQGNRFSALILGIVKSTPFQMARAT